MIEAAAKRARAFTDDDSYRNFYGGYINDAYDQLADEVPYLWDGLRETNYITVPEDYQTGTVTATNGSTSITGSSTVWTSAMDGRQIYFDGDDEVYTFTYVSATTGTLDKAYQGTTGSGKSYIIWKEAFLLTADVIQDPEFKVWWNRAGVPVYLDRALDDTWQEGDKTTQEGTPAKYRLYGSNTSNQMYLELNCPDDTGRYLYYDCSITLDHLYEYSTGTASSTQDAVTIVGSSTRWLSEGIEAGMWFRFEIDGTGDKSRWYMIEQVVSNTELKLTSAYLGESRSAKSYKVCNASKLPLALDKSIYTLAAALGVLDTGEAAQAKVHFEAYASMTSKIVKKQYRKNSTQIKTVYSKPGVRR